MQVIDLKDEHKHLYYACLEEWSDEMKEADNHKFHWCEKMKDKGLGVKIAVDENGTPGGMIQYIPIEHANVEGKDLYFISCIWVHGYKQGRGNFQKKGMGKALLEQAEQDVRSRGAKGIVAWGIPFPFWMRAAWYKKQGYTKVDQLGFLGPVLLWKSFTKDAERPKWIRPKKKPQKQAGKVIVTGIINGWCPAQNIVFERAKRAVSAFGDKVIFKEVNTFNRETLLEWGMSDGLFIDNKQVRTGPPPSYKKIRDNIARRVKKL